MLYFFWAHKLMTEQRAQFSNHSRLCTIDMIINLWWVTNNHWFTSITVFPFFLMRVYINTKCSKHSVQRYCNSQTDHLPMLLSLDPLQMFPHWPQHQSLQASSSAQLSPVHNQGIKYITKICLCWQSPNHTCAKYQLTSRSTAVTGYSYKCTSQFAAKQLKISQ